MWKKRSWRNVNSETGNKVESTVICTSKNQQDMLVF